MERFVRLFPFAFLMAFIISFTPAAQAEDSMYIQSFSDLERICEETYTDETCYLCRDEIVVDRDLTIPTNLYLQFVSLTIAEDTTLTVSEGTILRVIALRVDGTLDNRGRISQDKWILTSPQDILTEIGEEGHIANSGLITMKDAFPDGVLSGDGSYSRELEYTEYSNLQEAIALAQSNSDTGTGISLYVRGEKSLALVEDTVIPENLTIFLQNSCVIVNEAATVTVLGGMIAYENASIELFGSMSNHGSIDLLRETDLTVHGRLINENWLTLDGNSKAEVFGELQNNGWFYFMNDSSALINKGGTYSGSGILHAEEGKAFPLTGEGAREFRKRGSGSEYELIKSEGEIIAELKEAVRRAEEDPDNNKIKLSIEDSFLLSEDLEIPANLQISLRNCRMSVGEHCTLTVSGSIILHDNAILQITGDVINQANISIYDSAVMVIQGNMTNQRYLSVYNHGKIEVEGTLQNPNRGWLSLDGDSILEIKSGGIYRGYGTVHIEDRYEFPVAGESAPQFKETGSSSGNYVLDAEMQYTDPLSGASFMLPSGWEQTSSALSDDQSKASFSIVNAGMAYEKLEYYCYETWSYLSDEQKAKTSKEQWEEIDTNYINPSKLAEKIGINRSQLKLISCGAHRYYVFPVSSGFLLKNSESLFDAIYTAYGAASLSDGYTHLFLFHMFLGKDKDCEEALKNVLKTFDYPGSSVSSSGLEDGSIFEGLFRDFKMPIILATVLFGLLISFILLYYPAKQKTKKTNRVYDEGPC